jgi:hypothetical protein
MSSGHSYTEDYAVNSGVVGSLSYQYKSFEFQYAYARWTRNDHYPESKTDVSSNLLLVHYVGDFDFYDLTIFAKAGGGVDLSTDGQYLVGSFAFGGEYSFSTSWAATSQVQVVFSEERNYRMFPTLGIKYSW